MRTRASQIDVGAVLAAAGAIVLLVSLFLHWYRPGLTAWTVFETFDLVLAAIAVAVLAGVLAELGLGSFGSPRWLPALGAAALVIVGAALVNHPPAAIGHRPDTGIWLALGGAVLMLAGGVLVAARVSITVTFDPAREGAKRPLRRTPRRPPPPPPPEPPTEPLGG